MSGSLDLGKLKFSIEADIAKVEKDLNKIVDSQKKVASTSDNVKKKVTSSMDSVSRSTQKASKQFELIDRPVNKFLIEGGKLDKVVGNGMKAIGSITEGAKAKIVRARDQLLSFVKTGKFLEPEVKKPMKDTAAEAEKLALKIKKSKEAMDKLKKSADSMVGLGKTLSLSLTLPIVGLGTSIIKAGANFEQAMAEVSAISGATGEELQKLTDKAKEMGILTKYSASEAAEALKYMAMAGWKTEDMLDGLAGIMNLAAASGEELGMVSDIVTDALTAFGMSAKDSARFADVLAMTANASNTSVAMMGETFKYVAPVAGALKYSLEDTSIAIGLMANSGIKASQAGTALRAGLTRLVKPTDQVAVAMRKYNISITDSAGKMKPLKQLMTELRGKLSGLNEAEKAATVSSLFGQEAMSGWLAIINAAPEDFESLSKSIYNAEGSAQKMADTMNDTLKGQWTLLKSSLEGIAISMYEIVEPLLKRVVEFLKNLANGFAGLSDGAKTAILIVGGLLASLGPILVIAGSTVKVFASSLKALGITAQVSLGPVLAVIAGLTAVIAGLAANVGGSRDIIAKHLESLSEVFESSKEAITTGLTSAVELFQRIYKEAIEPLFTAIGELIGIVVDTFALLWPMIVTVFQRVIDLMTMLWDTVGKPLFDVFMLVVNGVINFFKENWPLISETVTKVFNLIMNAWDNILYPVFQFICSVIRDVIAPLFSKVFSGMLTLVSSVFKGIATIYNNVLDPIFTALVDAIAWVWDKIQGPLGFIKDLFSEVFGFIGGLVEEVCNGIKWFLDLFSSAEEKSEEGLPDPARNVPGNPASGGGSNVRPYSMPAPEPKFDPNTNLNGPRLMSARASLFSVAKASQPAVDNLVKSSNLVTYAKDAKSRELSQDYKRSEPNKPKNPETDVPNGRNKLQQINFIVGAKKVATAIIDPLGQVIQKDTSTRVVSQGGRIG